MPTGQRRDKQDKIYIIYIITSRDQKGQWYR